MKFLSIPFVAHDRQVHEKLPLHAIGHEPWNHDVAPSCTAVFTISHFDTGIHLKFSVIEPFLRVRKRKINGEVHKDNCVEFFIAFGRETGYYNFEFNCLGSVKAAYGKSRQHRKFLPPEALNALENNLSVSMDNLSAGKLIKWEICITLPVSIFCFHNIRALGGETGYVNFAKCGDNLPRPHFLSWVEIISEKPDFHQPAAFGTVRFEPKPILTFA